MHWRKPLDWNRAQSERSPASRAEGADVIIPVYGAAEDLVQCLESVRAHTDLSRHGVILALDGPQDAEVEQAIASFPAASILRGGRHLGFAATVNRGMIASTRDVVLLNSDTLVTERWLEKLIDAAYSHHSIGTVTPLSNHATLCSVPQAFVENLIPAEHDVASFARLVERVSQRVRPRIPTGVGFCLYIRRALLDDIGLFDDKNFAAGYGEENDFCMRALSRGWLHVADDATFVFHRGHRSFGATREVRQREAEARLAARHPRYMATIAAYMQRDPLEAVRARITSSLRAPRPAGETRITHVVHGWPPYQHAGTELYAAWLVSRQRERHIVSVYTRGDEPSRAEREAIEQYDRGVRVRIVTNHFTARDPLRRNAIRDRLLERDFERFLREERTQLLHVHHLAGHTFSLVSVARRLGIPIVMQLQDWWALCARVNCFHRDGQRCSGPQLSRCAACATLTRVPPAALTNRVMHLIRRTAARKALRAADAFIAGSRAIRDDYAQAVRPATPFHVIPYGVAVPPSQRPRTTPHLPLRLGYVGSIAPHKGVHIAVEAMRTIDPRAATLHLWGDDAALPGYVRSLTHGASVVFEGRFREDEKSRVYESMDVLLVPSIGLESFGLAAREAMASGVPVIATSGGALSEMFESGTCGELIPPGDPAALRASIQRLVDDPAIVSRWSASLPAIKSDESHAMEIERVYESVLTAKRTS